MINHWILGGSRGSLNFWLRNLFHMSHSAKRIAYWRRNPAMEGGIHQELRRELLTGTGDSAEEKVDLAHAEGMMTPIKYMRYLNIEIS